MTAAAARVGEVRVLHAEPYVRTEGLCKLYHQGDTEVRVLDGLDLELAPGEVVVVLGVSGTGKSTLLNILGGIDAADGGRVHVGGVELTSLGEAGLSAYRRDKVGFVFQFYNLLPSLTAYENVLTGLEAQGTVDRAGEERAGELLAAVGLAGKESQFPDQLSGGEQQRVAIARALVKSPPLLLADEPTGNLDHDTGERVLDLLVQQARATGSTLVVVTHNAALAGAADRTLSLREGRLVRER